MICALFVERARSPVDNRPYPFQGGQTTVTRRDPHSARPAGDTQRGDGGGDDAGQPARCFEEPGGGRTDGGRRCVSQGRPDLAGVAVPAAYQPTVLIAGERGPMIIELSRAATKKPASEKRLRR
jgi:hypothetical protein